MERSGTAYGETTFALDSLRIGDALVTGLEIAAATSSPGSAWTGCWVWMSTRTIW